MGVRSLEKGTKALAEIEARSPAGSLSLIELDVTSDSSIEAAVQNITAEFGVLDVLINNAGFLTAGTSTSRQDLRDQFETNLFGPVLLTQALEPLLSKCKDPRIVNVSTNLGSLGLRIDHSHWANTVPVDTYRLTKAALNMATLTQSYNFKDWEHPAKVFSYCPGYVVTNLEGKGNEAQMAAKGAKSPESSAQGIFEIITGKRDGEVGKFVTQGGESWPW